MAAISIQELEGLDATQLTTLKSALLDAMISGLVRGVSYSIAGRSFSFASLGEIRTTLAACNYALGLLTGQRSQHVRANFNHAVGRNA